jgi:hypothetical protein
MRYTVLYAASCPSCSAVARLVTDASITDLDARSLEDPQVAESLRSAGIATPDRPSLLVSGEEGIRMLSGWEMRRCLADVVGWRRSRTIARLLAAEWRARLQKAAAPRIPSRRGVIGGALAGLAGVAMSSGVAAAATATPDAPAMRPADPADAARVLKTATARQAVRTWGPAEGEVMEITGSQPVFVLTHAKREIYTFIDNSPGALRGGNPAAVSLGAAPTAQHALRYYTASGLALADVTASGGRVTATPVEVPPARPGEAVPDLKSWQIACFAGCIGRRSGAQCILTCEGCVFDVTGTLAKVIACTNCVVCAGPNGVQCLRECSII